MADSEWEVVAEFKTCPVCRGKKRFAESEAKKMIKKGWFREDLKYGLRYMEGKVYEPVKGANIPIGGKVPVIGALLDVCLSCGAVYAVRLVRKEVTKGVSDVLPGGLTIGKG